MPSFSSCSSGFSRHSVTNTAQKMNTDSEKDRTRDPSPEQPDSASAGSEGDTAADTTNASTTGQEATEEEKTVETTSPSPPSGNTGTTDKQPSGLVFGSCSRNVREESNVGGFVFHSFSPGQFSCTISSSVSVCVSVFLSICPA